MKRCTQFVFMILFVLFSSCENNSFDPDNCVDQCLFAMEDVQGEVIYMDCFNAFGVKFANTTDTEYSFVVGMPDVMDDVYKEGGKLVVVSAYFRPNTLQPDFPDPSFNEDQIYQMEIFSIQEK
ncbi:MAG: hypothetical protein P1U56_00895 [Saprospiraceae bacterium]|nr:hypothetical protein [Saprospiraceae bacterium]